MAAKRSSMASQKRKLSEMDMETFLEQGLDGDTSASESSVVEKEKAKKRTKKKQKPKTSDGKSSKPKKGQKTNGKLSHPEFLGEDVSEESEFSLEGSDKEDICNYELSSESESDEDEGGSEERQGPKKSDDDLARKVLDESNDEDDSEEEEERGGRYHKLPEKLEEASDEDDDEVGDFIDDEEDEEDLRKVRRRPARIKVTGKMISQLKQQLQKSPSPPLVQEAVQMFHAAVLSVAPTSSKSGSKTVEGGKKDDIAPAFDRPAKYYVEGGEVFNKVMQLCLGHLASAVHKVLGSPPLDQAVSSKSKRWKKLKGELKSYLSDLLQLHSVMSDAEVALVIQSHVNKLLPYYCAFPKLHKLLLKRMIRTWSQGEESTRLMAFLIIHKLLRLHKEWLQWALRQLYMSYVRNCRFTSPDLLPLIAFMRRTLVDTLLIDPAIAYELAFIFIRQLVIHLRNAVRVKKKENCQVVYNWQSVRCLELWVELLTAPNSPPSLQPLIYPLTQTLLGTIGLLPTAKFVPLRMHCLRALNKLSAGTATFIPILPHILEVFELVDFNKKHTSISAKPFNFACVLKFSKSQMQEKVFRDGLIDQLYELLMEQFHIHAHKLSFPELVLPAVLQLKQFLKRCKVNNFCKQMKQIMDKVIENSKFITQRRKSVAFGLQDVKAVAVWEEQCRAEGTPLSKYYATWRPLRERELETEAAGKDAIVGIPGVDELEDLKPSQKAKVKPKATEEDRELFSELFEGGGSDSDEDDEDRFLLKSERPNKTKPVKDEDLDNSDYSDFDSDELEQLAQSADEDEEDDNENGLEEGEEEDEDEEEEGEEEDEDEEEEGEEEEEEDEEESDEPPRKKTRTVNGKPGQLKANDDEDDDSDDDDDLQDMVEDFTMSDSD